MLKLHYLRKSNNSFAKKQFEKDPERLFKCGEILRHFKGNYYVFLSYASHTETGERLCIYRALNDGRIYARPASMMEEKIDRVKYPKVKGTYRFESVLNDNVYHSMVSYRCNLEVAEKLFNVTPLNNYDKEIPEQIKDGLVVRILIEKKNSKMIKPSKTALCEAIKNVLDKSFIANPHLMAVEEDTSFIYVYLIKGDKNA